MGTTFRIVVDAESQDGLDDAIDAAFDRIGELDRALSDYRADSELERLNATAGSGEWVRVSDDLWRVLRSSSEISDRSDHAFDVTVGPIVRLWRRAARQRALPKERRIQAALAKVGSDKLEFDPVRRAVRLPMRGSRLDLGGIAKGYALDAALQLLSDRGWNRVLIDGGGDLLLGDPPRGERGWSVGLILSDDALPPSEWKPTGTIVVSNLAVATSGDLSRYVEIDGVRYSHLVDPDTGLGLIDAGVVTVLAPRAMTADAWASALSVLGPFDGHGRVERERGIEARILALESEWRTSGFPALD